MRAAAARSTPPTCLCTMVKQLIAQLDTHSYRHRSTTDASEKSAEINVSSTGLRAASTENAHYCHTAEVFNAMKDAKNMPCLKQPHAANRSEDSINTLQY